MGMTRLESMLYGLLMWVFLPGAAVKTLLAAGTLPVAWKCVRSLDHSDDVS